MALAVYHVRLQPLPPLSLSSNIHSSEGAVTAIVAIFGFFLLPNTPLTTSWLNPAERELAHARIERDRVGDSTEAVSSMEGLRQACRDPRTWLFCFMQNFHLSACSFNSFFPTYVLPFPLTKRLDKWETTSCADSFGIVGLSKLLALTAL
jgi:hypothetical protein